PRTPTTETPGGGGPRSARRNRPRTTPCGGENRTAPGPGGHRARCRPRQAQRPAAARAGYRCPRYQRRRDRAGTAPTPRSRPRSTGWGGRERGRARWRTPRPRSRAEGPRPSRPDTRSGPSGRRLRLAPASLRRLHRQPGEVRLASRLGPQLTLCLGEDPLGVDLVVEALHECPAPGGGAGRPASGPGPRGVGADLPSGGVMAHEATSSVSIVMSVMRHLAGDVRPELMASASRLAVVGRTSVFLPASRSEMWPWEIPAWRARLAWVWPACCRQRLRESPSIRTTATLGDG